MEVAPPTVVEERYDSLSSRLNSCIGLKTLGVPTNIAPLQIDVINIVLTPSDTACEGTPRDKEIGVFFRIHSKSCRRFFSWDDVSCFRWITVAFPRTTFSLVEAQQPPLRHKRKAPPHFFALPAFSL